MFCSQKGREHRRESLSTQFRKKRKGKRKKKKRKAEVVSPSGRCKCGGCYLEHSSFPPVASSEGLKAMDAIRVEAAGELGLSRHCWSNHSFVPKKRHSLVQSGLVVCLLMKTLLFIFFFFWSLLSLKDKTLKHHYIHA